MFLLYVYVSYEQRYCGAKLQLTDLNLKNACYYRYRHSTDRGNVFFGNAFNAMGCLLMSKEKNTLAWKS